MQCHDIFTQCKVFHTQQIRLLQSYHCISKTHCVCVGILRVWVLSKSASMYLSTDII